MQKSVFKNPLPAALIPYPSPKFTESTVTQKIFIIYKTKKQKICHIKEKLFLGKLFEICSKSKPTFA